MEGVAVNPWSNLEIFIYQGRDLLNKLETDHENWLLNPIPVNNFQGVFIFWDSANLQIVEVFQYITREYKFRSVFSDPRLRKQLIHVQQQIYNTFVEYKYLPPKHPFLTDRLCNHIDDFAQEIEKQPFPRFRTFNFYRNMGGLEIMGLLYQYCSHPIFRNISDEDLLRLFDICRRHSITTETYWLLPFFLSQSDSIPLYGDRTLPNLQTPSTTTFHSWSPNDDPVHCINRICKGAIINDQFGIEIKFQLHEKLYLYRLYENEELIVGRWNQITPPHLPLILCPMSSERLFLISQGGIRQLSKTNQTDIIDDRIKVYNTLSRNNPQEFQWNSMQQSSYGWSNTARISNDRWEYIACTKWVQLPWELDLILLNDGSILIVSHSSTFILQRSDGSEFQIHPNKRNIFDWIDGILFNEDDPSCPSIVLNSITSF